MLNKQLINNVLDILLHNGGNFAEIYLAKETVFSFVLENNKIKSFKVGDEIGAHLRIINGDKTYSSYTNDFEDKSLLALAKNTSKTLSDQKTANIIQIKLMNNYTYNSLNVSENDERLALFMNTSEQVFNSSDKIVQVTFNYSNVLKDIAIYNSDGLAINDNQSYSRYAVNLVAKDGNITQTAYEGPGLTGKENILTKYPLDIAVEKALSRVIRNLKAEQAPTGQMPVILLGEAGGTMIHEACGHGLEADFLYKQTSIFNNKLDQKVAADCVTVIDDGSIPGLYGSYKIDDEGIPAKKTILIENGILKGYLSDRLNSKLLGIPLTGNGRRESFRNKPVPRMSNTFIENNTFDPNEIVNSVKQGLLVKRMGGGQVNITNGDFIFELMEGYLIQDGKQGKPIRGASLIGNGPNVLMDIDMIGNDKHFIAGVCGKYDSVPVGDAQPTLRIPKMTIGGQ